MKDNLQKRQRLLSLLTVRLFSTLLLVGAIAFSPSLQAQQKGPKKGPKQKVNPELLQLKSKPEVPSSNRVEHLIQTTPMMVVDGYVAIDAVAADGDGARLLSELTALGLVKGSSFQRVVSGFFPVDKVDQLETTASLLFANPAYTPSKSVGLVTSQADQALKADVAKSTFGVSGKGSKLGILSDSYNARGGAASGVASGDLPANVQVLKEFFSGRDEGRAMAELVYDVAPGADIAFHTASTGQAVFANGILALAEAGCNIIVDDAFYLNEPYFQDGIIAQAVNQVAKNKVTYFSAAANFGNNSYESNFRNSGVEVPGFGQAHDFGNGDIRQTFTIPPRGNFLVGLQWDDPFFSVSGGEGAKTDLDMLVYFDGELVATSVANNLGGDPFEIIGINSDSPSPSSVEIVITKYSGPDPQLIKWVQFGSTPTFVEYNTSSSTCVGHANADGAIAVGAAAFFNTPAFNPNLSTAVINGFSSKGGTPVFIETDGKKTGLEEGKRRKKPEITAVDGTNTTFFGSDIPLDDDNFPNFFGTSAAAPHAAAVAALMQEVRKQTMTPKAVLDMIQKSALDMDDPDTPGFDVGFDFRTGAGLIQADKCVELAGGKPVQVASSQNANLLPGSEGQFSLYPNPAVGQLNVEWSFPAQEVELLVYNVAGSLIYQAHQSEAGKIRIDLSNQPTGLYLVKLVGSKEVKTSKVMVSR